MNKKLIGVLLGFSLAVLGSAQEGTALGEEVQVYRQEGIASWYGAEFEGRTTASGETFNSRLLTAAHPSLPFGTVIVVTNTHNGKTVTLRVNDRGPFIAARILDVSRAAAEKLDMIATGTAPIKLETISSLATQAGSSQAAADTSAPPRAAAEARAATPSSPQATAAAAAMPEPKVAIAPVAVLEAAPSAVPALSAAPVPAAATSAVPATSAPAIAVQPFAASILPKLPDPNNGKRYRVQVGSYKLARNAVDAFNRLQTAGLNPAYERYNDLYRVVLAGIGSNEILTIAERLGAAGFPEALIREEP